MTNHETALQWTCRALASELANEVAPSEIAERGESLVAIAELGIKHRRSGRPREKADPQ